MSAAYLALKSLSKSAAHPLVALRHNLREIAAEMAAASHINPKRTRLNQVIHGHDSSFGVENVRSYILKKIKIDNPRKNAVHGIEIVVSLPPHAPINQLAFFLNARDWLKENYGGLMIHAVIHNDEEAPHMHVLILPIVNKRLQGNALMGNRNRLIQLQADFHENVCKPFGLDKPKPKSKASEKRAAQAVIDAIEQKPYLWTQSEFQEMVKNLIYKNPIAFFKCVGFSPNRKVSDFTKIMTQKVKPEPKSKQNHYHCVAVS